VLFPTTKKEPVLLLLAFWRLGLVKPFADKVDTRWRPTFYGTIPVRLDEYLLELSRDS
jgi:hypothetical protein